MSFELKTEVGGREVGFEVGAGGLPADRPTLILIHGAGGSRLTWRRQLEGLAQDLNVVALELPGHGRTPGPVLESAGEMAAWVAEVIEAWELPSRPVLGGHSMGGAVSIELALARPELLRGLVLIGTGASLPVNPALFDGLASDFSGVVSLIGKWVYHKSADPELVKAGTELMSANDPETLIKNFRACDRFDRSADLGRITAPTLVVCGQGDKMTTVEQSRFLVDNIPAAKPAVIEEAGHMVMDEKPEELNRAVLDFIGGL